MNRILKRSSAGLMALLLVFSSVPAIPLSDVSGSVVSVFAEGKQQTEPEMLNTPINFYNNGIGYNSTTYPLSGEQDITTLFSEGTLLAQNITMYANSNTELYVYTTDVDGGIRTDYLDGVDYSSFTLGYGVCEVTELEANASEVTEGKIIYSLHLKAVPATVTGVDAITSDGLDFIEYSGDQFALVTEGTAEHGTLKYAVTDTSTDEAPTFRPAARSVITVYGSMQRVQAAISTACRIMLMRQFITIR